MKQGQQVFRQSCAAAATLVALGLAGCAVAEKTEAVYDAARTAMTARSAYTSVKDMENAEPSFSGYSGVVAFADLAPREDDPEITPAFTASMRHQIDQAALAVGANVKSCADVESCAPPILSVQYREDAMNRGFIEKITVGGQQRGRLLFVDQATGRVIAETRLEGVETYSDMLGLIRGKITSNMLKSFPDDTRDMDRLVETLDSIPAVAPGQEDRLASS